MRFVKEENEFGFFRIADLRKIFKQLGEQPEEERGVNLWRFLHQLFRGQNVDRALPALRLDEVIQVQRRFPKKFVGALCLEREKVSLDGSGACGGDIAK